MKRSSGYVCVDLGPDRVAGVEVVGGSFGRWFTFTPLPGSVAGGGPADPARLARQLRAALDEAGITRRRVRVAIPDAAMLTRILDLPPIPRWHLARAIAFAVERAIPIPPADLAWTWTWEPRWQGKRPVRVVAGWRDVVEKVEQAMTAAGLRTDVIEPRSAALQSVFGRRPALLLERIGRVVQATAVAPGLSPFTAQAPVPLDSSGWPATLESLVMAARRHLGSTGRDLRLFVSRDLALFMPEALGARPVAAAIEGRPSGPPADATSDAYVAAIGLALDQGRLPALRAAGAPAGRRLRLPERMTGHGWVPALAAVMVASWSAVAAGTALLLGWHPSWPLAP